MQIKWVKRLQNGWIVSGFNDVAGEYEERFMDHNMLVKALLDDKEMKK